MISNIKMGAPQQSATIMRGSQATVIHMGSKVKKFHWVHESLQLPIPMMQ
jgi:hypothetical protein